MRNKLRRPLALLLSAVMIVTMSGTPVHAVADRGQPETGLCEHHAAHTDDCGYTEETPGTPCGHEHTEDCYTEVTECVHEHTPECYPEETEDSVSGNEATPANAEEREPENCPHICDGESGCITEKLDCRHEHKVNGGEADREGGLRRDSECGYTESTPGTPCTYVCEICNPQDSGEADEEPETGIIKQEHCSCLTLCTEGQINPDCPVCGAEDAGLSDCKGKAEKEDTKQPEDTGICKHHQEHDDACGYQPESEDSEGSPCTYECRICPIEDLIATLPDKVTEDNADEVRAQLDQILALFSVLTEDEQEQIDLSRCYALQAALAPANAPMMADGRTEQQDTDEASVTIGEETLYYATLEEAFAAANGQTATITMLENAECVKNDSAGSPLNITSGNVTLNLNGKALSGMGYGNYGIIDVSGGSLLVQGEKGTVKVAREGLSCRGNGKLIVEGITLNFVGSNVGFASAGIHNVSGTVTLNGTQMTGAASDGQIYHYSGTTTINNVTATGVTENCPKSVWYHNKGTLTINGGTFDKIAVNSNNYGGVKSVAELLGAGCAYKKQDGTWATADELAAMEISNVTVKKIPLTINPQGDISWYYGEPHTLAMNAAPVDGGNSVTYVWKNGETSLDCAADTCEIPADTPAGSYTNTCEATCDGYTLSHTFSFEIKQSGTQFVGDGAVKTYNGEAETTGFTASDTITVKATPTATGEAPANSAMFAASFTGPGAGQMAVFVGNTQVSEAVDAGADGTYTMTVSAADVLTLGGVEPNQVITLTAKFVGNTSMANGAGTVDINITAAAKVEKGGVTTYYTEFAEAWKKAQEGAAENPATVTLLKDVTLTERLTVTSGQNITLTSAKNSDGNDFTMNYAEESTFIYPAIEVNSGTFELKGGTINVDVENGNGVSVKSDGTFKLTGGAIRVPGYGKSGVEVSLGTATISGGEITADYGVSVQSGGTATISGGTITADNRGVYVLRGTVTISGGTIEGTGGAIYTSSGTILEMLGQTGGRPCAYWQGSEPVALTEGQNELPAGTYTVQACSHSCSHKYTHTNGTTHNRTCPACGKVLAEENCSFGTTGECVCGAVLAAALPADLNLTYNGTAQEPGVTVTVDGQTLAAENNYTVTYANNINAGDTAKATVTVIAFTGAFTLPFTIKPATPTLAWESTTQELAYTGNEAMITAPKATGVNGTICTNLINLP